MTKIACAQCVLENPSGFHFTTIIDLCQEGAKSDGSIMICDDG